VGATKINQFTKSQIRKAELYKALGHPARIAIIEFLMQQSSCVCGEIVEKIPLSQSTISQHLKELKKVGIIQGDIEGVKTCYCINGNVWMEMDDITRTFLSKYSLSNKCC